MNRSLVSLARRVLTLDTTPTPKWRFYSSPSSSPSNNKLFVGGLSWSVDEKTLTDAFSSYGDVTEVFSSLGGKGGYPDKNKEPLQLLSDVRIMYDKETGRSRGFGFVNFSKEDDARSAKDAMDGKAFLGRPLQISFALEKVRGAPVVVPRLSKIGDATNRN